MLGLAACLVTVPAAAQSSYLANARTIVSSTQNVLTNRLYLAGSTLAPVNTTIWIVADTARDGVPTSPPANRLLGPDDVVILKDVVDGTLLGDQAGRYQRNGISVTGVNPATAHIYVYLWNGSGAGLQPAQGTTFGLLNLGVVTPPEIGNAAWAITADIRADQHTVAAPAADPQPSRLAGVATTTAGGTNFLQFTFSTEAGVSYRVQSATNLAGNPNIAWTDEEPLVNGTGSPANWLGVSKTNGVPVDLQKFFRVVAQ